jgi:hypothetical protein
MPTRFVEVAAYSNSLEAGFAQGLLEEAGIPAQLDGLTSQSWIAGDVPATGFRVLVSAEHAERAVEVLQARPEREEAGPDDEEGDEHDAPDVSETQAQADNDPSAADDAEDEAALEAMRRASNRAVAPGAAWLLGLFIWGPISQGVACVWALARLLEPQQGPGAGAHRGLLWIVFVLSGVGSLVTTATGWPRLADIFRLGPAFDWWVWIDVALAVAILLAWRASRARSA